LGATITSASARISVVVTKAERLTYSLTNVADPENLCWRGATVYIDKTWTTTGPTNLSSVEISAKAVWKQTGYWGCMNQNGTADGSCILGRRGSHLNSTDVHSNCKFRLAIASPNTSECVDISPHCFTRKRYTGSAVVYTADVFGEHYLEAFSGQSCPQTITAGCVYNTTAPTTPIGTGSFNLYGGLHCDTANPNSAGPDPSFYVTNQWFGLDVITPIGDLITVNVPNDGTSYDRTLNITTICQSILAGVQTQIQAGIVFESDWGIAHNSLAPNSTPVKIQAISNALQMVTGTADEVAAVATLNDIILTFQLSNSSKTYRVHCVNIPHRLTGGS